MKPLETVVLVIVAILLFYSPSAFTVLQETPCTRMVKIVDNEQLNQAVAKARDKFLATRPHPFDRLTSTILVPQSDGTWLRGSFDQNRLAYPASCVKLAYMVSAIKWCLEKGMRYDCLDYHVRPMIMISDNLETGVVTDFVTGAPNLPFLNEANTTYFEWLSKRNYTQRWMNQRGLLEEQIILHKTYPSNSGNPVGAEKLAREREGMNRMNSKCAASLMLEIVTKNLYPEAYTYMMQLLYHPHESYTSYGTGLPPGSILYSKLGDAFDTLQEIAYIILPNGKSFVVSTFTNGFEPTEPINNLAYYIELLIETSGLGVGLPNKTIYDISSANFFADGTGWQKGNSRDTFGNTYLFNSELNHQQAGWKFNVNEDGLYEVAVWNPELNNGSPDAQFSIMHAQGTDTSSVNQKINGGRWVKLGDFNFYRGNTYSVVVVASSQHEGSTIVVNALKLTKWPDCTFGHNVSIPATTCQFQP